MVSVSPSSHVFSVRRCEPELVVPAKPTPRELKNLSDIDDQEGLRFQVPIIKFYKNNPLMKGQDPVRVIREALAKALVFYYPFAGRLIEGPNRKLIVDCTGEGVLFIEADANVTLEQLGDTIQPPCPYLDKLLYDVPGSGGIIGCPLLLIQLTRLICGGFIFALRMNHTMCDGLGLVQFLNTICEMSRGEYEPSEPPVWQRELFNARDPPRITCIHHEYDVVDAKGTQAMDQNNLVHQSFFFGPKEIRAIRNRLPPHLRTSSTFEVLTACLWKCRTTALELGPDEVVSFTSIVNARGKKHSLHVPSGYYGNAVAFMGVLSKAKMLSENPLGYAVELVKKAKARMSEEHIRSVADFMVIKGRPKYTTTGWNYIVCDTTRIGYREVDFGWGKPVYGGPAGSTPPLFSLCIRFKNKVEDGIVVPIHLPSSVMPRFQQELNKMTSELVEDSYSNVKPTRITSLL